MNHTNLYCRELSAVTLIKWLSKLLPKTQQQLEEEYLASSVDLVDLERRQRKLQRSRLY